MINYSIKTSTLKRGLKTLSSSFSLFRHKQPKGWVQEIEYKLQLANNSLKAGLKNQRPPFRVLCKKGFGLLEVLLSAVIIIIILAALVTIGRAALNNNEYLAQRAQAIYLAQEGLEMTRQIRDTNWIDGENTTKWNTLDRITTPTATGDYSLIFLNNWKLGMPTTGENILVGGVIFNRKINISSANDNLLPTLTNNPNLSDYAIKIKSTVTWTYSGQSKNVELSEILTNWRPDF